MFTYTLPIGFAYCTGVCLTPVRMVGISTTRVGAEFTVEHGTCPTCTLQLARVYVTGQGVPITSDRLSDLIGGNVDEWTAQRMGWRAFDAAEIGSRSTYVGGDYVDGRWHDGRYTRVSAGLSPNLTGRMYGWEMLSAIGDSIDVGGQREDGAARWGAILRVKAASSHFDAVLETLAREGQDLPSVAWDRYGAGRGEWTIGNGHHRLTASLLLGMLTFPLIVSTGDDYMCADDSMDDDDRPLAADQRTVWAVLRDVLPMGDGLVDVVAQCIRCNGDPNYCDTWCCPHAEGCPNAAAVVPAAAPVGCACGRVDVGHCQTCCGAIKRQGTMTRERVAAVAQGADAAREAVRDLAAQASAYGRRMDAEAARLLAEMARVQGEARKARARAEGYRAVAIG